MQEADYVVVGAGLAGCVPASRLSERVADASVIPRAPRGHTNWPTVVVAEQAADLIRAS